MKRAGGKGADDKTEIEDIVEGTVTGRVAKRDSPVRKGKGLTSSSKVGRKNGGVQEGRPRRGEVQQVKVICEIQPKKALVTPRAVVRGGGQAPASVKRNGLKKKKRLKNFGPRSAAKTTLGTWEGPAKGMKRTAVGKNFPQKKAKGLGNKKKKKPKKKKKKKAFT